MKNVLTFREIRPKRWIALLCAVAALHLAAIAWMTGHSGLYGLRQSDQADVNEPISVSLRTAPPPAAMPRFEPAASAEDAEPAPSAEAAEAKPEAETGSSPAGTAVSGAASPAQAPSQAGAGQTGAGEQPSWRASAPPSARLSYSIQARRQGQGVFGSGKINWQNYDSSYTLEGESSLLFFTVFKFQSEGSIDAERGISPILYNEKRFRKSETNTHFHRERNLISFSASTRTYPRKGGEQDRSSVVWQLASIGRHGSAQFRPGVQFPIIVAGARDAETWQFSVVGLEEVDISFGKTKAWHLVRKPRVNSHDQAVDVWLAPEKEWYPVRLRHTDKNGDYLDMTLSGIEPAAKQGLQRQGDI